MAKDDEKKDNGFTLEEILAEYGVDVSRWEGEEPPAAKGAVSGPDLPWPEAKRYTYIYCPRMWCSSPVRRRSQKKRGREKPPTSPTAMAPANPAAKSQTQRRRRRLQSPARHQ